MCYFYLYRITGVIGKCKKEETEEFERLLAENEERNRIAAEYVPFLLKNVTN